ncbi:AAA family ATPase [Pyxidicoccus sp. MSG2]|uniref:AAA family ATPase n=1 Tax=Pyxidicoccus sp. MSG2 TaxID=2996790 RepID=UPI00226DB400|nr:AAA family ATPase [Pyxidicoccus sp. MSG2]MCY1023606.1 AAA family ATPase [Pyxidicoccus sp. MSG2]
MPYLTKLHIDQLRHLSNFDIDLSPHANRQFSHLVITGPNGSGKTTLLNGIAKECTLNARKQFKNNDAFKAALEQEIKNRQSLLQSSSTNRIADLENQLYSIDSRIEHYRKQILNQNQEHPVQLQWSTGGGQHSINQAFSSGNSVFFHAPAQRQLGINSVTGPQRLALTTEALTPQVQGDTRNAVAGYILQLLVNKKTERTFASEDGESETVRRIDDWFESARQAFGILLDDPGLKLVFDRVKWDYTLVRSKDGREFNLHGLSHGHASAIQLFSELLVRFEVSRQAKGDPSFNPQGIAIIDELETHLHLRLQEAMLPFLTRAFPTIQFIVATHSPAVVASVPNAVVFDLETQKADRSDALQGIRYGDLATGHFGVQSDYDIATRGKLEDLERLFSKNPRTKEEEAQMRALAGVLAAKSHSLALDVLLRLKVAEVHASAAEAQE